MLKTAYRQRIQQAQKKRNATPLDLEAIVLPCSPNKEEAVLMKKLLLQGDGARKRAGGV
jgi:hypothetical protein